jgi:hypothetical protein
MVRINSEKSGPKKTKNNAKKENLKQVTGAIDESRVIGFLSTYKMYSQLEFYAYVRTVEVCQIIQCYLFCGLFMSL